MKLPISYDNLRIIQEARDFVAANASLGILEKEEGKYSATERGITVDYYPNGLIGVHPSEWKHSTDSGQSHALPNHMRWLAYVGPRKEYIQVYNTAGEARYWLLPDSNDQSLIMAPHPELRYVPVQPIQDYRITIDRKAVNELRREYDELYSRLKVLWGTMSRVQVQQPAILDFNDEACWYPTIQDLFNRYNNIELAEKHLSEMLFRWALPYKAELVPPTTTHHGEHYSTALIRKLRHMGKLENLQEIKK